MNSIQEEYNAGYKECMEKKAWLGDLAGIGVFSGAQNAFLKYMLTKNKGYSKELAQQFFKGLQGKNMGGFGRFVRGFRSGLLAPELSAISRGSFDLGTQLRNTLAAKKITNVSQFDLNLIQNMLGTGSDRLLQGKGLGRIIQESDGLADLMRAITAKGAGSAGRGFLGMIGKLPAGKKLQAINEILMDPKHSSFTANLVPALLAEARKLKPMTITPYTKGKVGAKDVSEVAGNLFGSAVWAPVFPGTTAMNLAKATGLAPKVRQVMNKIKPVKQVADAVDNYVMKKPIQEGFAQGHRGINVTKGQKARQVFREYMFNPLPVQLANTTRKVTRAWKGHAPDPMDLSAVSTMMKKKV